MRATMVNGEMIAAIAVEAGTAAVAVCGVVRCLRLQRFGSDPRLRALSWFFGLFAAAMVLHIVWQAQIGQTFERILVQGPDPGNFTGGPGRPVGPVGVAFFGQEGAERVNLWLAGHHALMLASLVIGVWAFGPRRSRPAAEATVAALSLAFIGDLVPAMLALEAGLTLYLAARSYINHVEVRSPGALQVALGFTLFFAGHLLFSVGHQPGMGHSAMGDVLNLVGVVLLVQALPGKT